MGITVSANQTIHDGPYRNVHVATLVQCARIRIFRKDIYCDTGRQFPENSPYSYYDTFPYKL